MAREVEAAKNEGGIPFVFNHFCGNNSCVFGRVLDQLKTKLLHHMSYREFLEIEHKYSDKCNTHEKHMLGNLTLA